MYWYCVNGGEDTIRINYAYLLSEFGTYYSYTHVNTSKGA